MADKSSIDLVMIDDQSTIIALMKVALKSLGYGRLEAAKNGKEGLELIRRIQPNVVICDINMPGMNGLEVLREVRCGNAGAPQALPFIFLTGVTESEVVRVALELDANAFMPKPFKPADLDLRLHRVLSRPHPVKPPAAYASVIPPQVRDPNAPDEKEAKPPYQRPHGVEKAVKELAEGAVLAVDIRSTLGSVLVSAGMTITTPMRDRLSDLVDVGVISPFARIEG